MNNCQNNQSLLDLSDFYNKGTMSFKEVEIYLNVRRFDKSENPEDEKLSILLDTSLDYQSLKRQLFSLLNISEQANKVIKVRNRDNCLVTLPTLLQPNVLDEPYTIDVTNINYTTKNNNNLLQDAYLDAVRQKLSNMEYRISEAEQLLPQLQWMRQNHMEETVNALSNRVAFLNRRIDELMPIQWRNKMPIT